MTALRTQLSLLVCALMAGGCLPDEAPPCVPSIEIGRELDLRVDSLYDASSGFIYEERFGRSGWAPFVGCAAVDGLDVGSLVTFVPRSETIEGSNARCGPYLATFSPEVVSEPDLVVTSVSQIPDVSMAAAFAQGTLDGRRALVTRELLSPIGDPFAEPLERELPPLVMIRTIMWIASSDRCSDAWAMRWEERR